MNTLHVSILNPAIMNLKQPFHHPYKQLTLHRYNKRTLSVNCVNNGSEDEKISQPSSDGIRFKRGSRRRTKEDGSGGGENGKKEVTVTKAWEEMTLNEKALELYVGEKGLLFWLNKLAYASIYIVIGGWILFRFVGPAFNLYQLDTPPLDPKSILKG